MTNLRRHTLSLLALLCAVALAAPLARASSEPRAQAAASAQPKRATATKDMRVRTLSRNGRFRRDLTLHLGLGVGYQSGGLGSQQLGELALVGVDIGVGAFVRPWTSLLVRVSGTFAFPSDDFYDRFSFTGIYGGSAQFWLADWLNIETGAGLATHWIRTLERLDKRPDFGLGFITGLNVPFFQMREHTLQLGVTYTPMLVRETVFHTSLLTLSWQYL